LFVYLVSFFLFLFRKRENGRAERPSISAAKLPVAGLRRQAATGVENFYPQFSALVAGNLPSAQTMTATPVGAVSLSVAFRRKRNPPRRAHDAAGIPPPQKGSHKVVDFVGKGGTTEWMRPAACGGAKDMEFVPTRW